jgi:hypothetical protein
MAKTTQKVNFNNCTHGQLFKAISKIQAKCNKHPKKTKWLKM